MSLLHTGQRHQPEPTPSQPYKTPTTADKPTNSSNPLPSPTARAKTTIKDGGQRQSSSIAVETDPGKSPAPVALKDFDGFQRRALAQSTTSPTTDPIRRRTYPSQASRSTPKPSRKTCPTSADQSSPGRTNAQATPLAENRKIRPRHLLL